MAAKKGKKRSGAPTGDGKGSWSRKNLSPVIMLSVDEGGGQFREPKDLYPLLTSFKLKESLTKATEVTLTFRNDAIELSEDPRFLANTVWKVRFGYFNDLSPVFVLLVRNLEPEYSDKCTLRVTLFDYSLNASQTSSSRNWGKIKSSDIAKQIAKAHSLIPAVEDSNDEPKKAWIQPSDMNDILYLRDLAAMIDFEVYVDEDPPTLFYRKKAYDASPRGLIVYYDDPSEYSYLKSFKPKVTSLGPYSSGVKGTDAEKKKGEKSTSGDASKSSPGLADKDNYRVSIGKRDASGGSTSAEVFYKKPVASTAPSNTNVKKLAEVKRQQILDKANEAASEHILTPSLRKGLIFEIAGVEKPLAGKWYITDGEHSINGTSAESKITWKRNSTSGKKDQANTNNKKSDSGAGAKGNPTVVVGRTRDDSGGNQSNEVIQRNQPVPNPGGGPKPVAK